MKRVCNTYWHKTLKIVGLIVMLAHGARFIQTCMRFLIYRWSTAFNDTGMISKVLRTV